LDNNSIEPKIGTPEDVSKLLETLRNVDKNNMLDCVLEMPEQINKAIDAADKYDEGDPPLDRNHIYLAGLGGSAITGELIEDMLAPLRRITIYRGTKPPRDKQGVIISSYSGNTREIIELSQQVTGGLRPVVFLTSGGELSKLGRELSVPVWSMPTGYQPRAAIGWSLALALMIMERWRITTDNTKSQLLNAANKLKGSLKRDKLNEHILVRAAYPIAEAIDGKYAIIFHSISCTGAAKRLAAQICENAKQQAFTLTVPEAMHNSIQGIAGSDPDDWSVVFMTDHNDPESLRESMKKASGYLSNIGFTCTHFPAAGDDQFELTLSRLFLADMVSLFLAARKEIDPTPINVITDLKDA